MTLTLSSTESAGLRLRSVLSTPFALPAAAVVVCGMLALFGVGDLTEAAKTFPFEVPAIYIALEIFSALVIGTGIGDALAVRLANRSAGRPIATMALSVTLLMATCALGNNLTHVGLILPILLALLSTMILSRGFIVGYLSLVMAIVNLAGASTPVGDFPALTIMASGITTFTNYLVLAFPLFGVLTPAALLLFYAYRLRGQRPQLRADAPPPETGAVLLAAKHARLRVDRATLVRLLIVLASMFAGWVALPQIPAWAIAWAGAAIAVVAAPRARHTVHIGMTDLEPVLKIGTFLGVAGFVATTGVLELIATALQAISHPQLLLVAMMIAVAVITSVVSAGPTAAVLLPVAQTLVLPGAALAGHGDLVAIAFAGAICAGSSVFLISATAGPLIARRVQSFGLTDDHGQPVVFGARQYLPFGFLNGLIQLTVAVTAVLTLYTLIGA